MKKSFTLIGILGAFLLAINISSCNEERGPKAPESKRMELDSTSKYYDQNYRVYTLEGCEYIVGGVGKYQWGSHKGNCKNPIHSQKSDTLSLQEKHFDCLVNEVIGRRKKPPYAYVTECGIMFYSDLRYEVGDTLKGFVSQKHK
jgi:hypothetical protein